MCVLIGNTVKTESGDYPCKTREEAEALFMQLREREKSRAESRARGQGEEPSRAIPMPQKADVD
ncbi:MAG TPA: hypothetical protein VFB36_15680 [Nevskiaceae bacterium]|nr:hypothetical protein [Nevskiaceae bacterium]